MERVSYHNTKSVEWRAVKRTMHRGHHQCDARKQLEDSQYNPVAIKRIPASSMHILEVPTRKQTITTQKRVSIRSSGS